MRHALISDIHSNLEAFELVLADIKMSGCDSVLFLGDIIGYGPNPNECMDLLLHTADLTLGGNHDWAVVNKTNSDYFNPYAREAVEWTEETLRDDHKNFLRRTRAIDSFQGFQLAHSSPRSPEDWRYIMTEGEALSNYSYIESDLCFIGHSHQPIIIEFSDNKSIKAISPGDVVLEKDKKYIINVGSVGQPRDNNPDACWVLYDDEVYSVEHRRVAYNITVVQKKVQEIGLPEYLMERLASGR